LKEGIVLFAHGSRDPEWARPFQRMTELVGRTAAHCVVKLAYLEIMRPSLEEAVAALAKSVKRIRVVPVFLGQGSHLKEDLPRLIAAVRGDYPGVEISLEPAIGEQPRIIEAIAALIAGGGIA
jgi:sirohydrochlorin cobaltochelatase